MKNKSLIDMPPIDFDLPSQMLPDPEEVNYYALERERKLYLDYDIGFDVMAIQRRILRWNMEDKDTVPEERRPIWLYIHSYGGHLDYMWGLIDAIEASVTPVYTVNMGQACSAASLIFMAGKKRYMMKRAKVVIHEGSAQMAGDSTKVLDFSDSYRNELKRMKDYILEKTNIPKATLMKKRNNDWELDSDYCLENKVCDVIVKSLNEVI